MTRSFNDKIRCPKCGHEHTVETDFERWMRNNPALDSITAGIVRFDLDVLVHKYITHTDGKGFRDIQMMMFVEVKTRNAIATPAQLDTFGMLDKVIRNRRKNINRNPHQQIPGQPTKVWSKMRKKYVTLKMFGGHLLRMDGTDPVNSKAMRWDRTKISINELNELLSFVRDPDDPKQIIDHRRRSQAVMFKCEELEGEDK